MRLLLEHSLAQSIDAKRANAESANDCRMQVRTDRKCFECGQSGHFRDACPNRARIVQKATDRN